MGSETNTTSPARLDMTWLLKPVVLCFPDHRSGASCQDQHGARKPSTRTDCPRIAALASSAEGRNSAVAFSMRGVISLMIREMVGCEVSKISAQTSSMIFCRAYPDDTIMA